VNKVKFSACVVAGAFCISLACQVMIYFVDQATVKQCKSHDWPASADQIHRDWCVGNGYEI
jgi:hypothetical protein